MTLPDSGGAWVEEAFAAGELVPPWSERNLHRVKRRHLKLHRRNGPPVILQRGRFYPRRFAAGTADVFDGDMRPMRVLDMDDDTVTLVLNHPLAQAPLQVAARIRDLGVATEEHGGSCNDIVMDVLNGGVGLQGAMPEDHHAAVQATPFSRLDDREDALFHFFLEIV